MYYNLPREPQISSFSIILQLFTGSSSLAEQVLHSRCIHFCVILDCVRNEVNVFRPDYWKGAQLMCMLTNGQLREVSTFRERETEKERSSFGAHSKFWGQYQRWVNSVTERRKQRQQQWMKAIFQPSVLASGCPQSTSHHYAFMPDLCDVGDVAASFLSALQDRKQRVGTTVNHSFCCISAATTNTETLNTRSSCSNRPGQSYFLSCGVTLSGKDRCKSYLPLDHLI